MRSTYGKGYMSRSGAFVSVTLLLLHQESCAGRDIDRETE
jgi:hypothetical protein